MKKKLSKYNILIDAISKTSTFRIVMILSFATIIYGITLSNNIHDYFVSILIPYGFSYFNIMFFLLILINTINNCNVITENYNYIIRLENRKKFAKTIIFVNFIVNLVWIFIFSLMFIALLSLVKLEYITLYNIKSYGINILVYSLFYILRYYMFALLISAIISLIYLKVKGRKIYVLILLFICGFLLENSSTEIIKSFQFLPWKYFEIINYSSFMTEVSYSLLYTIILEIIILVLYTFNQKKTEFKRQKLYFIINDIDYFIRKQKIIILLFIFLPIICSVICGTKDASSNYVFQTALGLNVDKTNPYILSVLIYVLNILGCIYIFIKSFIKDFSNISNIYLRYNYKKFFIIKSIILTISFFTLKVFQYLLMFFITSIFYKGSCSGIVSLFFNDLFFVLFLSFLFLLLYIIYKVFKKIRILICGLLLFIAYIYIIRQYDISQIRFIYYGIVCVFEIGIINFIILKNNKKVIQEIGGI